MIIETKLNLGDVFHYIDCSTYVKTDNCKACDGKGYIVLGDGEQHYCPSCYGKGSHEVYGDENWHLISNNPNCGSYGRPVGNINIEVSGGKRKQNIKITYSPKNMGNFYYEENCFASVEEAQAECDRRNKELEATKNG